MGWYEGHVKPSSLQPRGSRLRGRRQSLKFILNHVPSYSAATQVTHSTQQWRITRWAWHQIDCKNFSITIGLGPQNTIEISRKDEEGTRLAHSGGSSLPTCWIALNARFYDPCLELSRDLGDSTSNFRVLCQEFFKWCPGVRREKMRTTTFEDSPWARYCTIYIYMFICLYIDIFIYTHAYTHTYIHTHIPVNSHSNPMR